MQVMSFQVNYVIGDDLPSKEKQEISPASSKSNEIVSSASGHSVLPVGIAGGGGVSSGAGGLIAGGGNVHQSGATGFKAGKAGKVASAVGGKAGATGFSSSSGAGASGGEYLCYLCL